MPRGDVTIGYLFGMIEDLKADVNISEYSVTQTSLEQIFQNFANQEISEEAAALTFVNEGGRLALLNPDRKSTFVQKKRPSEVVMTKVAQKPKNSGILIEPEIRDDGKVAPKYGDDFEK